MLYGGVPINEYAMGGMQLKKSDLKDFMIVETGYDNEKLIVMAGKVVDDELNGYSLDDFTDELVNKIHKPESISKVYEPVSLSYPFELNIEKIFEEHKPQIIWERKPTYLSKKLLGKMNKKQMENYLQGVAYPMMLID